MKAKVRSRHKRRIVRLLRKLDAECGQAIRESLPQTSSAGKREPINAIELEHIYRARAYALGTLEHLGARPRRAS